MRDRAVLTTAMSSMSIAVATQTTARVQRFVVMRSSVADGGRSGPGVVLRAAGEGDRPRGCGQHRPDLLPAPQAQARHLVGRTLDDEGPQAHPDAVAARLETSDDLRQRAVPRRDEARLPRVDGDPDRAAERLGVGSAGPPASGRTSAPAPPGPARRGRAGRCRRAGGRRRRRQGARAARPADRAGAAGRRRRRRAARPAPPRPPRRGSRAGRGAGGRPARRGARRGPRRGSPRRAPRAARRAAGRPGRAPAPGPARRAGARRRRARRAAGRPGADAHPPEQLRRAGAAPPKRDVRATVRCGKSASSCKT